VQYDSKLSVCHKVTLFDLLKLLVSEKNTRVAPIIRRSRQYKTKGKVLRRATCQKEQTEPNETVLNLYMGRAGRWSVCDLLGVLGHITPCIWTSAVVGYIAVTGFAPGCRTYTTRRKIPPCFAIHSRRRDTNHHRQRVMGGRFWWCMGQATKSYLSDQRSGVYPFHKFRHACNDRVLCNRSSPTGKEMARRTHMDGRSGKLFFVSDNGPTEQWNIAQRKLR